MTIGPTTSLTETAFVVGTALENAGVEAVLSGGGAATVYAPDVNQSQDLDFILGFWSSLGLPDKCIRGLGFVPKNGIYEHADTRFTLEFPKGPLSIGDEVVTTWNTLREGDMVLNILSPTDSVRDRLLWFFSYNRYDFSALEQALGIALRQEIDLPRIKAWAIAEGATERFGIFEARYLASRAG